MFLRRFLCTHSTYLYIYKDCARADGLLFLYSYPYHNRFSPIRFSLFGNCMSAYFLYIPTCTRFGSNSIFPAFCIVGALHLTNERKNYFYATNAFRSSAEAIESADYDDNSNFITTFFINRNTSTTVTI